MRWVAHELRLERLKRSPLSCVVLCIQIANQCLKGCLNSGLTSFLSPGSIRAYRRSDKAFCLVNSNTFCASFSGQERAALGCDSLTRGPPVPHLCFQICPFPNAPNKAAKTCKPVTSLDTKDCAKSDLDGQDAASRQASEFVLRHLANPGPADSFSEL